MLLTIFSVLLTCTLFIPLTHPASDLNFSFPSSIPNDDYINYAGTASASDRFIQLTSFHYDEDMCNNTGRATYRHPMHLWDKATRNLANFTTSFSFFIKTIDEKQLASNRSPSPSSNLQIGDGLTFFLASDIFPLSHLNAGGGLGIGVNNPDQDNTSKGFPFVAIEFDTNQNVWELENGPHVGVDIKSVMSVRSVQWIDENEIVRGEQKASITYNGVSKKLSVSFTNSSRGNPDGRGELECEIDLREHLSDHVTIGFSASTGIVTEQNIITSWSFSSSIDSSEDTENQSPHIRNPHHHHRHHHLTKRLLVGLIVGGCLVIGLLLILTRSIQRRRESKKMSNFSVLNSVLYDDIGSGVGPMKFSYKQLSRATTNFAEIKKLGQGGFGSVYFGFLRELNLRVAIKRVSRTSSQGIKEYASEVKIITKLRHKNLVQLIGWCHEKNDLLLVYELLPNGSLDRFLFSKTDLLTWELRYKVAMGLASALLYLHEEWEQCVLHRDIKSSNVMLDKGFNAKLGDFGLARLVDHEKGAQTTILAGTMGYIAPESVLTGKASKETDIYSFGIVALEIACGRKPIEPRTKPDQVLLVEWVWELYGSGTILGAADPKLCSNFDEQEMRSLMIIGLWCAHPDYSLRPSIQQVVRALKFESPLPILPSKMPVATYSASAPVSNVSLPTSSFSFSNAATSSFSS